MGQNPPTVRLPRVRSQSLSVVLPVFIGFGIGLFLGHPIIGAAGGLLVWYLRARRG